MSYIGIPPQANFSSGLLDRFTSTTGTTVTLTHDIASENDIVVFINFVKQDSTTYSVGGTGNKTLTLGGTLVSSDIVEVHYLNIVGQTNAPSSGSVTTATINDNAVTGAKLNTDVISAQTALAVAPDSTDELLISDGGVLKRVDVSLVGGTNTPNFYAYANTNFTLSSSTFHKVPFNAERFDTANGFDTSTNTYTIPEAGKYNISFQVRKNNSRTDRNLIEMRVNGSAHQNFENGSYSNYGAVSGNIIKSFSANDTINLYIYHDRGSDQTFRGSTSEEGTFFQGFKIIE